VRQHHAYVIWRKSCQKWFEEIRQNVRQFFKEIC
jgi:hypothetical protein